MKKHWAFISLCVLAFAFAGGQTTQRKVYTTTPAYNDLIITYQGFARESPECRLMTYGTTDVGKPLHLFIISRDRIFDPVDIHKKDYRVLLINNGIHPGEPDGIDASIELVKTLLAEPAKLPAHLIICIVPVFNVDGCLNRGKYSRVNQNGPEEYGFRGNAKNLDLNRDFIKCDAENTKSLEKIYQEWQPDIFVDTHVSDGADYQYVMTLISTQRNKLHPVLSKYLVNEMLPSLYKTMKEKKYEMCPYVNEVGETPDEKGIAEFLETPRFSTGYTTQFNTIGFVTETHMWKPYNDRVWATYEFLLALVDLTNKDSEKIAKLHYQAMNETADQDDFVLNWELDTTKFEMIDFKGYEGKHKTSSISGQQRLYYDRNAPFTRKIKFYDTYKPSATVTKPAIYIIPQGWSAVIDRLKLNNVIMQQLDKDTTIKVETYYIDDYQTNKTPYEGHYLHHGTKIHSEVQKLNFYKGDYVIVCNQYCNRYVVETLEPQGDDSFFAWGFFDAILQQKEWFSDYIFEEKAEEILKNDPKLKADLEDKKSKDAAFAADHWAQLAWIYQHSIYHEKSQNRYPVVRLSEPIKLPVK
ncbi:MAG TPA: M14 family zinc carboxypeptidase [Bacteroidia bacterium]|jgi:hypothetical protein